MRPITKWSVQVPETRRIAEYIDAAFRVAQANVPGPVFLEMPLDLLMNWPRRRRPPCNGAAPRAPAPRAAIPRAIARAAELLAQAERPCFLVGTQIRWSPHARRACGAQPMRWAPILLERHGPRRAAATSTPALFSRSRRVRARPGRRHLRLRHPLRLPRRLRPNAHVGRRREDRPGRPRRRGARAQPRASTWRSTATAGVVLEQLLAAVGKARREVARGLARRRARRRDQAPREDGSPRSTATASPPNPLRVCAELGKRLAQERHRHRRRRRLRRHGRLRAQARVAAAVDGPWPARHARRRPRLRHGGQARASRRQRRPRLRRRQLRPPRARVRGHGPAGHPGRRRSSATTPAWTQIRRGQVELYGEPRAVATALDYTRYEKVVEALRRVRRVGGDGRGARPGARRGVRDASRKPACVNVKIAKSDFRKGAISV